MVVRLEQSLQKGKRVGILIGTMVILMSVCAILIWGMENRELFKMTKTTVSEQIRAVEANQDTGETYRQYSFRAKHKYLNKIGVEIGTGAYEEQEILTLQLWKGKTLIQEQELGTGSGEETNGYYMELAEPLHMGRRYTLRIVSSSGVLESADQVEMEYTSYNGMLLWMMALLLGVPVLWILMRRRVEDRVIQKLWIYLARAMAIGSPLMMYILVEFLAGTISDIPWSYHFLNIGFYYGFYFVLFAITNRLRFTTMCMSMLFYLMGVAEYFVLEFRGTPIVPYDILAIGTASEVASNYTFSFGWRLTGATLFMVVLLATLWQVPYQIRKRKIRGLVTLGLMGAAAGYVVLFFGFLFQALNLVFIFWAPAATYCDHGFVLSTFMYMEYMKVEKPEGYSKKQALQILEKYGQQSESAQGEQPDDIIVIMNESWSDLDYITEIETNTEYSAFYDSLDENTIKGNLYVSTFAGNTEQTEYEFFTGNTAALLPTGSVAYELYIKSGMETFCSILADNGYRTSAMHPSDGKNYNRLNVYDIFGFEQFLTQDNFENAEAVRCFASDESTYDKVIELYEAGETGDKQFIWDLTMQNHGSYTYEYENFEQEVELTNYEDCPEAEQYLSLMKVTDEAFADLVDYFTNVEDRVMIVMFGDHQPGIAEEEYNLFYGKEQELLTDEELEQKYITPFVIWANYDIEESYVEQLSDNYLSTLVLQTANITLPAYNELLAKLQESYPVINKLGVYDRDGMFWSWDQVQESADYEKLQEYLWVEYYRIKDGE